MGGPLRVFDRLVGLIGGLVLVVAGVAMIGWRSGVLARVYPATPTRVTAPWAPGMLTAGWWLWVIGIGGVVLVVLGLIWFLRHFRRQRIGGMLLDGSDASGRLSVDSGSATDAAATILEAAPGVIRGKAYVRADRHQLVAEFTARVAPDADLAAVRQAAAVVVDQTATMLGRDDLGFRVLLSVGRPGSSDDADDEVARVR